MIRNMAYPIYQKVLKKERKKIAPEIIRLTDELIKWGGGNYQYFCWGLVAAMEKMREKPFPGRQCQAADEEISG